MGTIKIVKEVWIEAIDKAGGMITLVAERLKLSRQTVSKYRESIPWVKRAFDDARFKTTDLAEKCIQTEIGKGNWKAAAWYLEKVGKDRGFGKEIKVETNEKPGVIHLHLPDDGRECKPDDKAS